MSSLKKELKRYDDNLCAIIKSTELCLEAKATLMKLEQDRQLILNKSNKNLGLSGIIGKVANTFSGQNNSDLDVAEETDVDRNNG